jgi:hypothetical protein
MKKPATLEGEWPVFVLSGEDQDWRVGMRPKPSVATSRAVWTAPITVRVVAAIAVKIMVPPLGGMYWMS